MRTPISCNYLGKYRWGGGGGKCRTMSSYKCRSGEKISEGGGGGEMSWTHYIHAALFQWYSLTNYLISIKSYDF